MALKNIPRQSWSPTRLGKFVYRLSKKWGIDGWLMGVALNIAKSKLSHGEWGTWCKTYCPDLSTDTILRLRKVADRFTDPSKLEGKRLMTAYIEAGILKRQERKTVAKGLESPVVNEPAPEPPAAAPAGSGEVPPDDLSGRRSKGTGPSAGGRTAALPPEPRMRGKAAAAPAEEPTTKDHLWQVRELALLMVQHLAALGTREEVTAAAKEVDGFSDALEELHAGLNHLTALLTPRDLPKSRRKAS